MNKYDKELEEASNKAWYSANITSIARNAASYSFWNAARQSASYSASAAWNSALNSARYSALNSARYSASTTKDKTKELNHQIDLTLKEL